MKRAWAIAKISMKQVLNDPLYLLFTLGMPVVMTWVMGFLPDDMAGLATSGVIVMFLALNLMMSAGVILEEKQNGTWSRILVSPAKRHEILAGYLTRLLSVAWIQAAMLIGLAKYVFDINWPHVNASLLAVLASYILSMAGLGMLLAGWMKTPQQLPAVSSGVASVGTMLSGVFFPPNGSFAMELIAKISPMGWAARGLNDAMNLGVGLSQVAKPVFWMLGLGFVFLAAGVSRIKFEG